MRACTPVYLANFTIGPQGGVTPSQLSEELTIQDVQNSFNPNSKTGRFFYGSIHYSDVFRTAHTSKYCFRIDGIYFSTPLSPSNFSATTGTAPTKAAQMTRRDTRKKRKRLLQK
jgi:hypothetical protein